VNRIFIYSSHFALGGDSDPRCVLQRVGLFRHYSHFAHGGFHTPLYWCGQCVCVSVYFAVCVGVYVVVCVAVYVLVNVCVCVAVCLTACVAVCVAVCWLFSYSLHFVQGGGLTPLCCCSLCVCVAAFVAMYVALRVVVCVFVLQCVAVSRLLIYSLHFAPGGNTDPNLLRHPIYVCVDIAVCAVVRVAV